MCTFRLNFPFDVARIITMQVTFRPLAGAVLGGAASGAPGTLPLHQVASGHLPGAPRHPAHRRREDSLAVCPLPSVLQSVYVPALPSPPFPSPFICLPCPSLHSPVFLYACPALPSVPQSLYMPALSPSIHFPSPGSPHPPSDAAVEEGSGRAKKGKKSYKQTTKAPPNQQKNRLGGAGHWRWRRRRGWRGRT